MKNISIIAAIGENSELGFQNRLLCHLPKDLKNFKELTSGHTIVMGRKTWDSLPKKPLPNRRNVVLSRNPGFSSPDCEVFPSFEAFATTIQEEEKVFVIGGAQIYQQLINQADTLHITHIRSTFEADVFFPPIDAKKWHSVARVFVEKDEKNPFDFEIVTYRKVKSEE